MKLLIFYLLYYDNSDNFFSKLGFLQTRNAMEYILHQVVIGKQDGSKVEGKNLGKKRNFH